MAINSKLFFLKLFFLLFLFPVFSQENKPVSQENKPVLQENKPVLQENKPVLQEKKYPIDPNIKIRKEKTPALALGIKFGFFNGASLSSEIITTLLKSRISFYGDISYANFGYIPFLESRDTGIQLVYVELGINYYIVGKVGQGLYLGISNSLLDLNLSKDGLSSDTGNSFIGRASTDELYLTLTNFKLGLKIGTKFFFRIELGYALGEIPTEIIYWGDISVNGLRVRQSFREEIDYNNLIVPGINKNGTPTANIGIGYQLKLKYPKSKKPRRRR